MDAVAQCCAECGSELPRGTPKGLCPHCALRATLPSDVGTEPAAPDNTTPTVLPRSFGDYELLEEIARGGMGIVYRARQKSLDRIVAVKMLLSGSQADFDTIRRFRGEAVAAGSLKHPNIVGIHEVGRHEGNRFIVMDYVAGPNLAHAARKPLPPGRAAELLATISSAIHYAHQHRILHRDLKPSNIIIDENGQPHVTDFGLAKGIGTSLGEGASESPPSTSALHEHRTADGQVLGSPAYMPPEQADGRLGGVGRWSDVYSLGAMLYHLLTGKPPFEGTSVAHTLHLVLHDDVIPPRRLNATVPLDLETICLKCLEKAPARRYQTAGEMADELHRFLVGETIQARPVGRTERIWRWSRRKPALAVTSALAVLAVLLAAYNAWSVHATKVEAREREDREWALLFDRNSPLKQLHWSSEDLAGFFGQRPKVQLDAERLFIGMYLEADQQHMVSGYAPLLRYLEQSLSTGKKSVKLDLIVFKRRSDLEQMLVATDPKDQVHFGRIGESGLSRLLNDASAALVPMVQQIAGGKVSVVFTLHDTGITNLAGLKGRRLAFGSSGSTASGYKLPKLLLQQGLTESDVQAVYNEDSEHNVDLVLSRDVDAGVTRKDKYITYTDPNLRVLAEFDTTRMPWLATKRVSPGVARRFQEAMTALNDPTILQRLPENPTNGFAAVDAEYFRALFQDMKRVKEAFSPGGNSPPPTKPPAR